MPLIVASAGIEEPKPKPLALSRSLTPFEKAIFAIERMSFDVKILVGLLQTAPEPAISDAAVGLEGPTFVAPPEGHVAEDVNDPLVY